MLNRPITITIVPRRVISRALGIWAGFTLFDWQKQRLLNWLNECADFGNEINRAREMRTIRSTQRGKLNAQNGRSGGENAS